MQAPRRPVVRGVTSFSLLNFRLVRYARMYAARSRFGSPGWCVTTLGSGVTTGPPGGVTTLGGQAHLGRRGLAMREFVVGPPRALVPRKALWLGEVLAPVSLPVTK